MYKFKIQRLLKEKLGVQYKCNIAEGKFGDTFLLQMPSGDTKAGKIVSEDRMHRGEMEVWPLLDHQNVVRLEKTILMPDLQACCFVMPRYHMTLKEIVKTDCFQSDEDSLFDMKRWLLDTLCAVEYLHQHNLCHLNILASNVLISYDSRAKLGGLRLVSPATHPVSGCGIDFPFYPPELCYSRGKDVLVDGIGVDLWSLGIMTLRLFTRNILEVEVGKSLKPWSSDVYKKIYKEIKELEFHIDYTFPEMEVSPLDLKRLQNFIRMFLSLKPNERVSARSAKKHRFLSSGLFMPKTVDPVWKKKASCVIIEMNVEQHNTVENVRERCEGRGNTNAPLKPHDGHQLVRLFETSEDYEGEKDLDKKDTPAQMETLNAWDKCCSAAVQDFHLSSIYKLKATSDSILITNKVVRFVIKEEFSGRPTPKKCQSLPGLAEQKIPSSVRMETSVAKRGLKESRGEPKDTDIQRVPDREKTGTPEKKKKSGLFSRTKGWFVEKFRFLRKKDF